MGGIQNDTPRPVKMPGHPLTRCTYCNWSTHDVSAHGELCRNGHPLALVGRYRDGKCRQCHRDAVKRYARRYPDRVRANWQRWSQAQQTRMVNG